MIVKFTNTENHSLLDIIPQLEDVIKGTKESLQRDKGVTIEDTVLSEINIKVGLGVEGKEEPQFLTIDHHEGVEEPFTWVVDLAEGKATNNEDNSFIDPYEAQLSKGETPDFEEIETKFPDEHLTIEKVDKVGDMQEIVYSTDESLEEAIIVKLFEENGDKLITEYAYTSVEEYEEDNGE